MAHRKQPPKIENLHDYLKNPNAKLEGVAQMLHPRFEINSYDEAGYTLLHYAVRNPNSDHKVVEYLLQKGADVNVYNMGDQCNALFYAARNPNVNYQVIETLLKGGANVNAKNFNNHSNALIYATQNPNMSNEVLELLLKHGAKPNVRNYVDLWYTPLHYAIMNPNFDGKAVEILLEYGADIHCVCAFGDTPLQFALVNDFVKYEIVKVLILRETEYYDCLRKALESYASSANSHRGCLELLKHIVVERVVENPHRINDFYNCKSVLGKKYFDVISCHSHRNVFAAHVNECVQEINHMKRDYIFECCPISEIICSGTSNDTAPRYETEMDIDKLLSIWFDDSIYPIYSDVIKRNIRKEDVVNILTSFRICSTNEESNRRIFLDNASSLLIVKDLNLNDLMSVIWAFYDVNKYSAFAQGNVLISESF